MASKTWDARTIEKLKADSAFSFRPKFSLFAVTSRGEYSLVGVHDTAEAVHAAFKTEAVTAESGLEIRIDGVRFQFPE